MFPAPLYQENLLLLDISEGSENAFEQIFRHYREGVFSLAVSFTKSHVIAQELTQDVFVKVWINRKSLPEVDKFDAFLFITARNHILNQLRQMTRRPEYVHYLHGVFAESVSASPEHIYLQKEMEQVLGKAVENLPARQKDIFTLSRHHRLNQEAIAAELNISKHTVKSHMNKALKGLSEQMEHYLSRLNPLIGWFFVVALA